MNLTEVKKMLEEKGQSHLLKYYDELSDGGKENLIKQIEAIDFSVICEIEKDEHEKERGIIKPLGALTIQQIEENRKEYESIGMEAIKEGKVGALLLAGGQGTRLGYDKPKGMFNIGETKELYIFECIINNLMQVVNKAGAWIPLAIMTSDINYEDTVNFLSEHNYFGYNGDYVYFFIQDMSVTTDFNGKIHLTEKGKVSFSPNGNGGWYTPFVNAGIRDEFVKHGVEWINVFAVDNVLQKIADPCFVGATVKSGCVSGAKVVSKAFPEEKIGLLCTEDGKPSIVEYYEMTDEMMYQKDENGKPLFNYGVILNYLFRIDELDRIIDNPLPIHVVEKKVPYIDENGNYTKPEKPNGYKYEKLVLDLIHLMRDCLSYEVVRDKEFAPIKNLTGVDSLESARKLLEKNGIEY